MRTDLEIFFHVWRCQHAAAVHNACLMFGSVIFICSSPAHDTTVGLSGPQAWARIRGVGWQGSWDAEDDGQYESGFHLIVHDRILNFLLHALTWEKVGWLCSVSYFMRLCSVNYELKSLNRKSGGKTCCLHEAQRNNENFRACTCWIKDISHDWEKMQRSGSLQAWKCSCKLIRIHKDKKYKQLCSW